MPKTTKKGRSKKVVTSPVISYSREASPTVILELPTHSSRDVSSQASRQPPSSPLSICGNQMDSHSRLSTPSKRFKKDCVLTAEEEEDVAEWVRDNKCFYNKKLELYCHTEKKRALWEVKASELGGGIDVGYLISWYKSMRTRYGKLSKEAIRLWF